MVAAKCSSEVLGGVGLSTMLCSANYWQVQTEGDTIKAKKGLQIKYGRPAWDLVSNDCDQIDLNWQKLEKT